MGTVTLLCSFNVTERKTLNCSDGTALEVVCDGEYMGEVTATCSYEVFQPFCDFARNDPLNTCIVSRYSRDFTSCSCFVDASLLSEGFQPTLPPSRAPMGLPTIAPTDISTVFPTFSPSLVPTLVFDSPTLSPTIRTTFIPTFAPTSITTETPTMAPTYEKYMNLTRSATITLTVYVQKLSFTSEIVFKNTTSAPSIAPTLQPTLVPSQGINTSFLGSSTEFQLLEVPKMSDLLVNYIFVLVLFVGTSFAYWYYSSREKRVEYFDKYDEEYEDDKKKVSFHRKVNKLTTDSFKDLAVKLSPKKHRLREKYFKSGSVDISNRDSNEIIVDHLRSGCDEQVEKDAQISSSNSNEMKDKDQYSSIQNDYYKSFRMRSSTSSDSEPRQIALDVDLQLKEELRSKETRRREKTCESFLKKISKKRSTEMGWQSSKSLPLQPLGLTAKEIARPESKDDAAAHLDFDLSLENKNEEDILNYAEFPGLDGADMVSSEEDEATEGNC